MSVPDEPSPLSDVVADAARPKRAGVSGPRRRRWIGIGIGVVGGVVLAAVLGAVLVSRADERGRPVALTSLAPGRCFQYPSAAYLQAHRDASDGLIRDVVPVSCTGTHRGEVVAQAALDTGRLRYDDAASASMAACREPFADYNPDFWALPPNAKFVTLPPRHQDLSEHPVATCLYLGPNILLTGPLRADPSRLTAGQRRYLDAVRLYDSISADGLDARESTDDHLTAWAKEMAAAEQHAVDELQKIGAPAGAEQQFAVVLDQHRKAVAAWQAAAAEDTRTGIHRRMAAAREADHASMDPDEAVRAALGLATTMRPSGYSL
ncbi:hypothetical protein [Kitasatospora sp. NPDC093558]|uniref:hypothetical protein n=1 Tax=Kitasatospora sp. NPDC093558 TaxID=3155201 RepID=UPI0034234E0F